MREVQGREAALLARVAETAASAGRFRQTLPEVPNDPGEGRHDHLGDPVAPPHHERLGTMIDQDDPDFSTVIGVDRARRVRERHPVFQGQAAARPDLGLVALRQGDGDSRGDEGPLTRGDDELSLYGGTMSIPAACSVM